MDCRVGLGQGDLDLTGLHRRSSSASMLNPFTGLFDNLPGLCLALKGLFVLTGLFALRGLAMDFRVRRGDWPVASLAPCLTGLLKLISSSTAICLLFGCWSNNMFSISSESTEAIFCGLNNVVLLTFDGEDVEFLALKGCLGLFKFSLANLTLGLIMFTERIFSFVLSLDLWDFVGDTPDSSSQSVLAPLRLGVSSFLAGVFASFFPRRGVRRIFSGSSTGVIRVARPLLEGVVGVESSCFALPLLDLKFEPI